MARRQEQVSEVVASDIIDQSEIEQLKAQAAAELAEKEAEANQPEQVTEAPVAQPSRYVMPVNPNSIRQTIRGMLQAGSDTKAIAAVLAERFPNSAAAAKSVKHIAYYRAELKKERLQATKS